MFTELYMTKTAVRNRKSVDILQIFTVLILHVLILPALILHALILLALILLPLIFRSC